MNEKNENNSKGMQISVGNSEVIGISNHYFREKQHLYLEFYDSFGNFIKYETLIMSHIEVNGCIYDLKIKIRKKFEIQIKIQFKWHLDFNYLEKLIPNPQLICEYLPKVMKQMNGNKKYWNIINSTIRVLNETMDCFQEIIKESNDYLHVLIIFLL